MFADLWIITLFMIYGASAFLLLGALPAAMHILRYWEREASTERQLLLERKNYLVSVALQYALFFQIILLIFFLQLVNVHLPGLIRGAMCAAGTLSVNAYGYWALYVKIAAVFIYLAFLFINALDQSETGFPLTPNKYTLFFASILIFGFDITVTVLFIAGIKPDIIAACCSVNFTLSASGTIVGAAFLDYLKPALALFYTLGLALPFFIFRLRGRRLYLLLALVPFFVFADIIVLKYHFVKFIYGMPAHNCLFDIFWGEYHFAGYLIFGTLALFLGGLLMLLLLKAVQTKHLSQKPSLERKLKWLSAGSLIGHLSVLSVYWLHWVM